MKRQTNLRVLILMFMVAVWCGLAARDSRAQNATPAGGKAPPPAAAEAAATVYPTAILPFQERGAGVKEMGNKVSDVLFASLVANPDLILVERTQIESLLQEAELNLSGMVSPAQATKVGQLTGAKILVTGSVMEVDKTLYLVAKVIGTETSRVLGESVKGTAKDDIAALAEQLATKVAKLITTQANLLVPKPVVEKDRVAAIKAKLGDAKRPVLHISVGERHVGQVTFDPAAQTELTFLAKGTGFDVLDASASAKKADLVITGEGMSELATRRGNLVSVKARLEIKVVDPRTDKVIVADRQTVMVVDLTEQIAGKSALERAAAELAERILPQLVK